VGNGLYFTDYLGTGRDPFIITTVSIVTYDEDVIGVPSANIGKVLGVNSTSVGKVIGV
jgi:hypothetical protein